MHRYVLHEAIGDGPHPCHWCGKEILWMARRGRNGERPNDLVPDHLDGDPKNNTPENLVPSCYRCNALRGVLSTWERETGKSMLTLRTWPEH